MVNESCPKPPSVPRPSHEHSSLVLESDQIHFRLVRVSRRDVVLKRAPIPRHLQVQIPFRNSNHWRRGVAVIVFFDSFVDQIAWIDLGEHVVIAGSQERRQLALE